MYKAQDGVELINSLEDGPSYSDMMLLKDCFTLVIT